MSCGVLVIAVLRLFAFILEALLWGVLRNVRVPGQRVRVTLWRARLSEQRSQGWVLSLSASIGAVWALLPPCPRGLHRGAAPFLEETPALVSGLQAPGVYRRVGSAPQGPIPTGLRFSRAGCPLSWSAETAGCCCGSARGGWGSPERPLSSSGKFFPKSWHWHLIGCSRGSSAGWQNGTAGFGN